MGRKGARYRGNRSRERPNDWHQPRTGITRTFACKTRRNYTKACWGAAVTPLPACTGWHAPPDVRGNAHLIPCPFYCLFPPPFQALWTRTSGNWLKKKPSCWACPIPLPRRPASKRKKGIFVPFLSILLLPPLYLKSQSRVTFLYPLTHDRLSLDHFAVACASFDAGLAPTAFTAVTL